MWVCCPSTLAVGLHGSEMSHSCASPAHDASAVFVARKNCTSWHAWKPRFGVVSSLSGCSLSCDLNLPPGAETLMIEIFLCGTAHALKSPGPVVPGGVRFDSGYDAT